MYAVVDLPFFRYLLCDTFNAELRFKACSSAQMITVTNYQSFNGFFFFNEFVFSPSIFNIYVLNWNFSTDRLLCILHLFCVFYYYFHSFV